MGLIRLVYGLILDLRFLMLPDVLALFWFSG